MTILLEKIFTATVISNLPESIGSSVHKLQLRLNKDCFSAGAGQFVALAPINPATLAPRPFTIVSYRDNVVTLLINAVGTNTREYTKMPCQHIIELYGSYGKEIEFDQSCTSCIFVGGGIGNAALVLPTHKALIQQKDVTVYLGAREEEHIPALAHFHDLPITLKTIAERGSTRSGYVTDLLYEKLLTDNGVSTVVACGPKAMLRKIHNLCVQFGNPCITIVEEVMICGMGACKGCAIFGGIEGKEVLHVCSDGPAFDSRWIFWNQFSPQLTTVHVSESRSISDKNDIDTHCMIGDLRLSTPFMNCSGTLDLDACMDGSFDLTGVGAFVIKGLSLYPRSGNPMPRVYETPSGMLNSIGLEYIGIEAFIKDVLPYLRTLNIPIIANINGTSIDEYCVLTKRLSETDISALEVNISCPNVKKGGMIFGIDPSSAAKVTSAVKMLTHLPVIIKLTPNVTDITVIAKAVEDAGADIISLINTVLGTSIDIWHRKTRFANVVAGLSGPAIRPIALRCVLSVANTVHIPIIGMGGNENGYTAAEFMMAGATATAFGTSGFANRTIFRSAIDQLREVAHFHGYSSTSKLVKCLKVP